MAMNGTFPRFGIQSKNIEKWSWLVTLWTLDLIKLVKFRHLQLPLYYSKNLKKDFLITKTTFPLSLSFVSVSVSVSLSLSLLFLFFSLFASTHENRKEEKKRRHDNTTQHNTTQHHTTPTIQERTENQTTVKFDDSDLTRFLIFFFFSITSIRFIVISFVWLYFPFLIWISISHFCFFVYMLFSHTLLILWTIILFFNIR